MRNFIGVVIVVVFVVLVMASSGWAMCGSCGPGHSHGKAQAAEAKGTAAKVNNTVCPVSGDAVDMKNPVTIEHNGKIYNLCCSACVEPFKSDPEKYINKVEEGHSHEI